MTDVTYEPRHEHGEHYIIASLGVGGLFRPACEDGRTKLEAAENMRLRSKP